MKVYTDKIVRIATFIGGPLIAGYFISKNFEAFNEKKNSKISLILGIFITAIVMFIGYLLPENVSGIPLVVIYTILIHAYVKKYQLPKIETCIENGAIQVNIPEAIGLAFISIILISGLAFIGFNLSLDYESKQYGRLNHEILYHKTDLTSKDADEIAIALTKSVFFDNEVQKFVQLDIENDTLLVKTAVVSGSFANTELMSLYSQLAFTIKVFYKNKEIKLVLSENYNESKTRVFLP